MLLISSGHNGGDSMFVNSTPSGDDAFLISREQLVPRDKDEMLDLYDARAPHTPGEVVGFPEAGASPCGAGACEEPVESPPAQPTSGSGEFSGPENPPRKHQKNQKKRHHKKHKKKHKPSSKRARGVLK